MTLNAAFTPGPWTIEQPWSGFSAIRGHRHELIFGLAAGSAEERQTPDICVANAHLIAAAPDLYAALKALVAGVERDDNPRDEGHFSDSDEMVAARAALAKAEGRP